MSPALDVPLAGRPMDGPRPRPAYRIETERLLLRCFEPADAETLARAVEENREHLRPWMSWAASGAAPFEEQLALVCRWRARFDLSEEYVYGAFEREGGALVGSAGLHPRAGPDALDMGYWLCADRTGHGLCTELARALTRVGFELLRLEFLQIRCDPRNERSAAIPRRLGYTLEGVLRRRGRFPGGVRRDEQFWTLFSDEYAGSPAASTSLAAYDAIGRRLL